MKKVYHLLFILLLIGGKTFSQLPAPALVGYWHNWNDTKAPYIYLDQVDSRYNVVCLAFAIPRTGTDYDMVFTPLVVTETVLKSQIQTLQAQGRKVVISIGGANHPVKLDTDSERNTFISSMGNILSNYNFDGMDIDLEGSSVSVTSGTTIANPTDVPVKNLILAINTIMDNFQAQNNKKLILTMAPETAYVQGGMSAYSGVWGAYLPIIHALRDRIDLLHVQLYNSGTMYGIDRNIYTQGTADFVVAMTEAVIKGFDTSGGIFQGLSPEKIAVGLPACASAAGGGYIAPETVRSAVNYLLGKGPKPGSYTLQQSGGYPSLRGMMTWSVNWDKLSTCGATYEYAQNFQTIFGNSCQVPTGLMTSNVTSTGADLAWNPVAGALSYNVRYKKSSESTYQQVNTNSTSLYLTGLIPGNTYAATVQTVCATGAGSFCPDVLFATLPDPGCSPPENLAVSNITASSATADWSPVTGASGYMVRYKPVSAATFTEVSLSGTTFNLSGLSAGVQYEISVKTICSAGAGPFGIPVYFSTEANYSCNNPYPPTFSNIHSTGATASWRSVKGATGYVFRFREAASAVYTEIQTTSTSYNLTGLKESTGYLGSVRVKCRTGISAFSSEVSFITTSGGTICDTPNSLVISSITSNSANAAWQGVSGADAYEFQYHIKGALSSWTNKLVTGASFAMSGLKAGTLYETRVRARCAGGDFGAFSNIVEFTTAKKTVKNAIAEVKTDGDPDSFALYPNPVSKNLHWETSFIPEVPLPFSIHTILGTMVIEGTLQSNHWIISVEHLDNGMYFFRSAGVVRKFVVMH